MSPEFLRRISAELQLPEQSIAATVRSSHARIRRVAFKKRNGETRVAYQAAATTKPILHWLRLNPLSKLPISEAAVGFRAGCSILNNARAHRNSAYSIRIDIKDFFPSITKSDIRRVVLRSEAMIAPEWPVNDVADLVENVCFERRGRLPIGFPTSPILANAVMFEIDSALLNDIKNSERFGSSILTRYADDFVFSTDKRGACAEFLDNFRSRLASCKSPALKVNDEKTRFMSRAGGSTMITGLRVTNHSTVRVHADYRDHVRLLLHLYQSGKLSVDEHIKLAGHLAYVEHVDPKLFTRLSFKYADQIAEIRRAC